MGQLTTIFEISADANGLRTEFLFRIAIGVVILLAALAQIVRAFRAGNSGIKSLGAPIFLVVWALFWLGFHLSFRPHTAELLQRYRAHQFSVVEGPVFVEHEQPAGGHSKGDVIAVGGKTFEISYFSASPGYIKTIAHGGVLKNGVYARLTYYDGTILKVEIRKPP
jgi:hypothetical protein